jgi:hypothetical protein
MRDEGLDPIAAGPAKGLGSAKVRGIRFDESRIEVKLADQNAQLIPQTGLTVVRTIWSVLFKFLRLIRRRLRRPGRPTEFLDRAQSDPVRLAKSPVDSTRFRYPHLGAAEKRRYIRWIGVSKANEATRSRRLINGGLEEPAARKRIRESLNQGRFNAAATLTLGYSEQAGVRYIPSAVNELNIPQSYRYGISRGQFLESVTSGLCQAPPDGSLE